MNIELNTHELDILAQSLEALQDNCERANKILARDKIDTQPIEELKNKMRREGEPVNADESELRLRAKQVVLSNQAIIEFAYLTKNMIRTVYEEKLSFSAANCYTHCFYTVRSLLKLIESEYLAEHKNLTEFYQEGRELDNSNDRIRFDDCLEL